jgi:hypothetical protein
LTAKDHVVAHQIGNREDKCSLLKPLKEDRLAQAVEDTVAGDLQRLNANEELRTRLQSENMLIPILVNVSMMLHSISSVSGASLPRLPLQRYSKSSPKRDRAQHYCENCGAKFPYFPAQLGTSHREAEASERTVTRGSALVAAR